MECLQRRPFHPAQADAVHSLTVHKTELDGPEKACREVIERITEFENYIDILVKLVPGVFRIWYGTSGKQEGIYHHRPAARIWNGWGPPVSREGKPGVLPVQKLPKKEKFLHYSAKT